ncbi:MAG TPA: hypothetical protein VL551_13785 [Actinospica sp.]|nr:hypothetical protein [Actinospica sp.]
MSEQVLKLIAPYTGAVRSVVPIQAGYRADVTLSVRAAEGRFFVKSFEETNPDAADPREVAISGYLRGVSPALVGYVRTDSLMVLVYEHVEGRHANLSPGSADIAHTATLVDEVGRIELPSSDQWRHRSWKGIATADEVALLDGTCLLHSDINPTNVLVKDGRAWLVDWSSPTVGAAVINLGELVTQLIAAGNDPEQAERVVEGCEAWRRADRETVDTLATVLLRMHRKWERDRPGWRERFPVGSWLWCISPAVEDWAEYRGVTDRATKPTD